MEKLEFISSKKQKIVDLLQAKGLTFNEAFKALRERDVKIDGERIKANKFVEIGSKIEVFYQKSEVELQILYQDENLVVVNKPRNIEVAGENSIASRLKAIPVHRLDRNTTGLVVLAKNEKAANSLEKCFKNKTVIKKYLCQVYGQTNFKGEVFSAYLLKDAAKSNVKIFSHNVKGSKLIQNQFETVENLNNETSIVECQLLTGRTHQIRAHLAYLGHPIIGDGKYGKNEINKKYKEKYQKLHCFYLKIEKIDKDFLYLQNKEFVCPADFYQQN